jgi:DNA polymerase-1
MRLVFDLETDGLLETLSTIHCLVIRDVESQAVWRYNNQPGGQPLKAGLKQLQEADQIIGHNVLKFDLPAIQKIFPDFRVDMTKVRDTLVMSRLIYADIGDVDQKLMKLGRIPGKLFGSHGLEAWGYRLQKNKGDYSKIMQEMGLDPWASWNQDMEDYCVLDTEVTSLLLAKLESKDFSPESIELEHQVAIIIARQERYGFMFDVAKAAKLYATLVQKKLDAERTVKEVFKPRFLRDGKTFTPKRDNKTSGYTADCPFTKIKLVEFNPGSRDHIGIWLKALYNWEPTEFTAEGKPQINETTLNGLDYPEVKPLKEYLMLEKRCGQISEGNQAWLKKEKNGRIHGSVNTNGAVTGRMTHSNPNMAQVPASYSPYGHECRELFCVPTKKKLVGADAAALELRDLAGYMAAYDNGEYIKVVLEGDKKKGTDIHSVNARALGLDPKGTYFGGVSGRDIAKTWFYAFIYGSGDENLGFILTGTKGPENKQIGTKARSTFLKNLPALGKLVERVKAVSKEKGYLRGLDGRLLTVRSQHAALNTLLQSAGAVQMKKALVLADQELTRMGFKNSGNAIHPDEVNYEFVANVHDEFQSETDEDIAETVGKVFVESIRKSGEHFKFKCPLDGEFAVGNSWAETH